MNHLLRISDAASLAFHAMVFMVEPAEQWVSTHEVASALCVSENHLAKVCQRLSKAGLIEGTRGPKGGFRLVKPADSIKLLEIYEAIDGPLDPAHCLLGKQVCSRRNCILGGLMETINREVTDKLSNTTLAQLATAE